MTYIADYNQKCSELLPPIDKTPNEWDDTASSISSSEKTTVKTIDRHGVRITVKATGPLIKSPKFKVRETTYQECGGCKKKRR